ncbi:hypothetical protein BIW11_11803 [Tropilaelaps mercedesae]|uniref:Uncharacterized protein n=1 Tax=Tropilaelaps mercedesae TaxID=418985 RepID=A0A1V9XA24_9ACAR|nr:hypothetical protein BIW11_11803 [Tropilaelaps mercedesae]
MSPEHRPSQSFTHETATSHNDMPEAMPELRRKPSEASAASDGGIVPETSTQQAHKVAAARRDVACQTDAISYVGFCNSRTSPVDKLENRATQTEPATRSVFTRSSRFLPTLNDNSSDRPHTAASMSPSHRGDSTAVLSSGRGRGRFRGRGHNRVRPRRAVSLPNVNTTVNQNNQDQIDPLNAQTVIRGRNTSFFSSDTANTPNDILAILEARLGETPLQSLSTRSLQEPPAPPPVSPTESTPVTQSHGGTLEVLSVKVMAQDIESLSTSDNFTILAPKSLHKTPVKPVMVFGAKRQHLRDFSTWTTEIDSTSDRPPRTALNSDTALFDSSSAATAATSGSSHTNNAPGTSLLMSFDGLNAVDTPEVRNRRRGVRGFLCRLLGKESTNGQKVSGTKSSTAHVDPSTRTLGAGSGRQTATAPAGSNSDSTG